MRSVCDRLPRGTRVDLGAVVTPRKIEPKGGFTAAVMSVCQPDQGVTIIDPRSELAVRFLATE